MKTVVQVIHDGLTRLPRYGWKIADFYLRIFSWVNYALVALVGVGINFLVNAILLFYMPWYFSNLVAIMTAWSWNWANSVGPLGYLWGFAKNDRKTIKN